MDDKITCKFCQQKIEKAQSWAHMNSCSKKQVDNKKVQPTQEQQNRAAKLQFINKYLDIIEQNEEILERGELLFQTARIVNEKFTYQAQKNCKICWEKFNQEEIFILLNCCSSGFHKSCFNKNLRQSTKCFLCKQAIFVHND